MKDKRESFNSRWGFILACIGSAVGMGNIWMFPTRVSLYGGGSFLIPRPCQHTQNTRPPLVPAMIEAGYHTWMQSIRISFYRKPQCHKQAHLYMLIISIPCGNSSGPHRSPLQGGKGSTGNSESRLPRRLQSFVLST